MRTAILLFIPALAFADTNEIHFTDKVATFSTLDHHSFTNVSLIKADLDGVLVRRDGFAAIVSFTNLAPDLLSAWKIPTNRIAVAAERAAQKSKADQSYRQRVAEQREHLAKEQESMSERAAATYRQAAESQKNRESAAIRSQRERVKQLQRENERLWQKYADGPPPVWVIGGPDDPDVVRAMRIASDNALRQARERLEDMRGP